jgi:Protein of unknown function (DUF2934)
MKHGSAIVSDSNKKVPTHEEIALRAFEIYLKRGGESGGELDDWLAAEKELTESREAKAPEPKMPDVKPLRKRAAVPKR